MNFVISIVLVLINKLNYSIIDCSNYMPNTLVTAGVFGTWKVQLEHRSSRKERRGVNRLLCEHLAAKK